MIQYTKIEATGKPEQNATCPVLCPYRQNKPFWTLNGHTDLDLSDKNRIPAKHSFRPNK
jgi:hypothetical protein